LATVSELVIVSMQPNCCNNPFLEVEFRRLTVLPLDVSRTEGKAVNGSTMAMAFMNITTDALETGFYQIFCVSNALVTIRLQVGNSFLQLTFQRCLCQVFHTELYTLARACGGC
jgi:hypothetical protein